MTGIVDTSLYSKIITLASNPDEYLPKFKEMGFDEESELYKLLREYSLTYRDTGNGPADVVNNNLPLKIQALYKSDRKTKDFFDTYFG